jgi:hypothetical protein
MSPWAEFGIVFLGMMVAFLLSPLLTTVAGSKGTL